MKGVIGIDVGGTNLRAVLADVVDGRVHIIDRRVAHTEADHGPDDGVVTLTAMIEELLEKHQWQAGDVGAVGVAAPGPTDPVRGVLLTPPNLPKWRNAPLREMLEKPLGIPVHLENDANLAGWGEFIQGAGRGCRHLLYVTVSTGIGGGIVIDGQLYSGASGTAGEVGHVTLDPDGPLCNCGSRGCLEAMASGTAIARMARERIAAGAASSLSPAADLQATDVAHAAEQGDALAQAVMQETGTYLGLGLGGLVNILNPEVLVLGGGAVQSGEPLLAPMRRALQARAFPSAFDGLRVEVAQLGQDAGLIGAAEWAVEHVRRQKTGGAVTRSGASGAKSAMAAPHPGR
jgi:glucokinase